MNFLTETGHIIFLGGFVIQLFAIMFLLLKNEQRALFSSNAVLLAGLIVSFISTLSTPLFSSEQFSYNTLYANWIRLDGLSTFFLFIIQLIAIPTTIYSISYLKHYVSENRPVRSFILFYIILILSTQLLVMANQIIFFLVLWEVMSIAAYLAITFEREKTEVQHGGFYFFASSHVIIFILYIMFFLLHQQSGSWFFSDIHLSFSEGWVTSLIFILSFIGFGIKAGFMPFHFWLPQAHPIAPTMVSAFLSGVLIKLGIYGILRTFLFLQPVPEWCAWLVLFVSIISAIFGVWYALAQHDIKRLLAYHSVENIGIIGLGIGIGFIGSSNNLTILQVLGFGGALLHCLNHAIFKSLLFLGSGVIYQNLGIRNIEFMGGLVHRAKFLAISFLIGSVAICGIPPFNGFISEFIIYKGFFISASELHKYYPIILLMFVVGLAFVGGLAVACFTKVNSIIFLGNARKEDRQFHTSVYEYVSLGILTMLCVVIGFFPQPFTGIVNKVVSDLVVTENLSSALIDINWIYFTLIFISMVFIIAGGYLIKLKFEKKYGRKISPAWGCGYEPLTPRMQYTASSFADELNSIPKSILVYHKNYQISDTTFPLQSEFQSHSKDFIDSKFVLPLYKNLKKFIAKLQFLSTTDIRYYIGYILIIIVFYGLLAFLWN